MTVQTKQTKVLHGTSAKRLTGIFTFIFIFILVFTSCKQQQNPASKTYSDPITGMEFVFVKGGCYQMGNPSPDDTDLHDSPVHEVCVDDFYIGKYEVTQEQWNVLMEPIANTRCGDNCPARCVTWENVQVFINKLAQQTGKKYRLPTSAEWEYAAGSRGKNKLYSGTDDASKLDEYAWSYNTPFDSGTMVHPVGGKKPNGLGLYDMTGNVWEWVNDWSLEYYYRTSPKDNPQGPDASGYRTIRGGRDWIMIPWNLKITSRTGLRPGDSYGLVGFRLVYQAQ